MAKAKKLPTVTTTERSVVTFGVCAAGDPRIDQEARDRTENIVETIAGIVADQVRMPNGTSVNVVWTPMLIDGELSLIHI